MLEAEIELRMARDKLAEMIATHKAEIDSQRFQLEDAIASANLDDKTQSRIDTYHAKMGELEHKRETDMAQVAMTNKTARDSTAAKLNNDAGVKGREADIKEREIANKEAELSYKERTGNQGI